MVVCFGQEFVARLFVQDLLLQRIVIHAYQQIPALMRLGRQNTLSYFFLIKCTFLRQYSIDEILFYRLEFCLISLPGDSVCSRPAGNKFPRQCLERMN